MKKLKTNLLVLLTLLAVPVVHANPYDWKVTRVVDGDTVEFESKFLPKELGTTLKIRVLGVDTPEKGGRAKCPKEAAAGQAATDFAKQAIAKAQKVQIELKEWDKFGGRVLGDVIVDGKKLSELLISNGHARPYFGEAKKSWCD